MVTSYLCNRVADPHITWTNDRLTHSCLLCCPKMFVMEQQGVCLELFQKGLYAPNDHGCTKEKGVNVVRHHPINHPQSAEACKFGFGFANSLQVFELVK